MADQNLGFSEERFRFNPQNLKGYRLHRFCHAFGWFDRSSCLSGRTQDFVRACSALKMTNAGRRLRPLSKKSHLRAARKSRLAFFQSPLLDKKT